jgi:hypothetical protein
VLPKRSLIKVPNLVVSYKHISISDRILRIIEVRADLFKVVAATHGAGVAYIGSRVLKTIDQHCSIPKKPSLIIHERASSYKKRKCEHSEGTGELHFETVELRILLGQVIERWVLV